MHKNMQAQKRNAKQIEINKMKKCQCKNANAKNAFGSGTP